MLKDFKFALRMLRKSPTFVAAATISLALGIGANAAMFSLVNALLLKRLAVPRSEQLVTFAEVNRGEATGKVWRMTTVEQLAKTNPAFAGLFGWFVKPVQFSAGENTQWVMSELVTGQYFKTLQVEPAIGRLLTDDDVRNAKANPVCVLSYGLWQREFSGDPGVVGRGVFLNGHAYRVLGVTARGFSGAEMQHRFDLQIPATRIGDFMPAFGDATGVDWLKTLSWLRPMARLKPNVTRAEAQEQTRRLMAQLDRQNNNGRASEKESQLILQDGSRGFDILRSSFGRPLLLLMGIVALVLLVACANLANLMLARTQTRAKEFAVRMSIGASRARVIRQLLIESFLLAACGGVTGTVVSFWITRSLLAFLNSGRSAATAIQLTPDANIYAFLLVLPFATAICFGLVPAWQAGRPNLLPGLKQEQSGGGRINRVLLRRTLVVLQISLSLVVVFAAGLLTRTLRTLKTVDLGFRPDQVVALNVDPAAIGHSNAEILRILDEILSRTRALPDVRAASLAASTPNGSMAVSMSVEVAGYTPSQAGDNIVNFNFVSRDYFATIGQKMLRGRDFRDGENKDAPRVAIVNQKFVRHYLGGKSAVGRMFKQGGSQVQIVAVVEDAQDHGARSGPKEAVYIPEKQGQMSGLTLLVRTTNNANGIVPSLRAIVKSIDGRMPVYSVHALNEEIEAGLSTERILGYLSTLFAALTTLLAGVGLYGVLSYSVVQRTREIGIRFAIGAQRQDVVSLFARESLILVFAGVMFGVPLALLSTRALRSLVFGLSTTDLPTLGMSILALAIAAFLAIGLPLMRAAHINPVTALQNE